MQADNEGISTFISPNTFYGDGVMSYWVLLQKENKLTQFLIDQE
jgi:hypothetical protein